MAIKTNMKHAVATENMAPVPSKSTSIVVSRCLCRKTGRPILYVVKAGRPKGSGYISATTSRSISKYPSEVRESVTASPK